jgi:5-methylthioribose kinase
MTISDLTTVKSLKNYLRLHKRQPTAIQLLTGGTANYVYRATFENGSTTVYKHAAPYLHSNTKFAFDPLRMDYENRILDILSLGYEDGLNVFTESSVRAVRVLSYDEDRKLLCMEDGGQQNLKSAYTEHGLDMPKIGEELGKWIAAFHTALKRASLGSSPGDTSNNDIAVRIYRYSYESLSGALQSRGYDSKIGERINNEFGSLLATDNECVCHGDFWPGNVLMQANNSSAENPVQMTIVDWEMVRRGTSATDVGQFAAEAFLLDRFRGGRGLLAAFLTSYATTREAFDVRLGRSWLKRVVVHWAVHVAFWPTRVPWTDQIGTDELMGIGVDVLTAVLEDDWEKLGDSPLLMEVKGVWKPILERA